MQTLDGEQRRQWNTDGYIVVENALSRDEVTFFNEELDRIRKEPGFEPVKGENLPMGHYGQLPHTEDLDPDGFMDRRDLLPYGKHFIELIDRPNVFDLVVDIMGPYILHSMSQAIVRAPNSTFPGYTHTDGGEALRRIRVTESSVPIAMKALYLLTDTENENTGNLTVFPGSHLRAIPYDGPNPPNPYSPGAAQIRGKAGDCILFPHALWHGPSRNESGHGRRTLLYNYCQLFVRQYDYEVTPEVNAQCTHRQRRLLGDLGYDFMPGSYFYGPKDQLEVITGV